MRSRSGAITYWAAVAAALAATTTLSLVDASWRSDLQNILFDAYQRWRPRVEMSESPVRIVEIDDESIRRLGHWPWPRAEIAKLLRAIESARPAAIAVDILFSEPERADDSTGDDALAAAVAAGPVVLGDYFSRAGRAADIPKLAGFAVAGDDPLRFVPLSPGLLAPLPALLKGASGVGFMNWLPDRDRVVRRVPLVAGIGGQLHPSLAMEALRVAQGASSYIIKASNANGETAFGAKTGIVAIKNGDAEIATERRGELRIYYADSKSRRATPAWKALQEGADLSDLADKIVLLGVNASAVSDGVATPFQAIAPGVDIYAQALEQVVSGVRLARPDWAPGAELLFGLALSLALAFALPRVSSLLCVLIGGAALWAFAGTSAYAFASFGLLLDPVAPTLSSTVVYLTGMVALYSLKNRQEREMRSAFGRFVSPAVVARLAQHPENLKLGGEERVLTVMFCDLRSFTTLSEGFTAVELTHFLNDYLTPMTDAVLDASGTVDKYIGDAIMAFWNAPLDDPNHARNAVETALKMRVLLASLNARWRVEAAEKGRRFTQVKFGIGLNTGECCVGNLGSTRRFDYSAIGDEVNVTSRLEGSSKQFGVDIVASERTRALTPDYAWLEIDQVLFKNKTRPVGVFALAGGRDFGRSESFLSLARVHTEMLAAYRSKNFGEAEEAAAAALALAPSEIRGLYHYNAGRFARLERSELSNEWLPLLALEEK